MQIVHLFLLFLSKTSEEDVAFTGALLALFISLRNSFGAPQPYPKVCLLFFDMEGRVWGV